MNGNKAATNAGNAKGPSAGGALASDSRGGHKGGMAADWQHLGHALSQQQQQPQAPSGYPSGLHVSHYHHSSHTTQQQSQQQPQQPHFGMPPPPTHYPHQSTSRHHHHHNQPPAAHLHQPAVTTPAVVTQLVNGYTALDNKRVLLSINSFAIIGKGTFGSIEKATVVQSPVGQQSPAGGGSVGLAPVTTPTSASAGGVQSSSSSLAGGNGGGATTSITGAIKKVHQDPRYKNRELNIMQQIGYHTNIVQFVYYFYTSHQSTTTSGGGAGSNAGVSSHSHGGPQHHHNISSVQSFASNNDSNISNGGTGTGAGSENIYLHLVMECMPENLAELIYRYNQSKCMLPALAVRLFAYQLLRALAYLHTFNICHRDIKSSNVLVDERTMRLKLCDFGSAKEMAHGMPSVSYISSRYYRAPELLFGARFYTVAIDVWSAGCVLGEMLRMGCVFMGADSLDQLVKIIRVLGAPSAADVQAMNPNYGASYSFPNIQPCPVKLFFPRQTPGDLLDLMCAMLVYNPGRRISPGRALTSSLCFRDLLLLLRSGGSGAIGTGVEAGGGLLPNGTPFPPLLDFGPQEKELLPLLEVASGSSTGAAGATDDCHHQQMVNSISHNLHNINLRGGVGGTVVNPPDVSMPPPPPSHTRHH